jgi:hypothetical protein
MGWLTGLISIFPANPASATSPSVLPTLTIDGQQTANRAPATTYASPVSNLEFDPRIDLQSRNMAEAQGDVTVRGGIFENTGFRVGSATLLDPQTGHYFAELPIAPEMLRPPEVLTGSENALLGFNSTVATIDYDWRPIREGGSLTVGGGEHDLNFQRLYQAFSRPLDADGAWLWGIEAELSRSESDGTIAFGDHDFERGSARLQLRGPNSQTDFLAGYQAKNFSWPNMYTPPNPPFLDAIEFERLKTRLFFLNHRQEYDTESWFELSAYHRRHTDDYLLDATSFDFPIAHETEVDSVGGSGWHQFDPRWGLHYAFQWAGDAIRSTSLEAGPFTSRESFKASFLPRYRLRLDPDTTLDLRFGLNWDYSNRDGGKSTPNADITWTRRDANGDSERIRLSFAEATQVPGYTAIGGSETSGVFRSNQSLGRESSQNIELALEIRRAQWTLQTAAFYRRDRDLVDWTFGNDPFARSANPVDIDTTGFEAIATHQWGDLETVASYAYLHKDEDYGEASIEGSFYALNFPEHRATLGLIWRPLPELELRVDNEWRHNRDNPLRGSADSAIFTHLAASYYPRWADGLELFLAVDNLWDDDFEDVPGTPGRGDQFSLGATYRW